MDNADSEQALTQRREAIDDAIIDRVTAILGLTELLLLQKPKDPIVADCVTKIMRAATSLTDLVAERAFLEHKPKQV
jgi:hypothetical protein